MQLTQMQSCVFQDRHLHQGVGNQKYYMPTSMDKGITNLRQWLSHMAGPIPWPGHQSSEVWAKDYSRREMLDRYAQHTQHCKHCSKVSSMRGVHELLERIRHSCLCSIAHSSVLCRGSFDVGQKSAGHTICRDQDALFLHSKHE